MDAKRRTKSSARLNIVFYKEIQMKSKKIIIAVLMICFVTVAVFAEGADGAAVDYTGIARYVAAAVAVGIGCIAGGMAVGRIGAAAMGAMSENAELSGKALPFVGLAEGICLWGFLVALLMIIL